tara:strand:+ start:242 stop:604 length:363 start_codon:yes stop_codon:yes gene_type:complete
MLNLKTISLISLLLLSIQANALNLAGAEQPFTEGLYDNRTCNDLYMQASALEQKTFHYKTNYYSDKRVASYALAVVSPTLYFFAYAPYQNHLNQTRSKAATSEIELVRLRLAEKRCFEQR